MQQLHGFDELRNDQGITQTKCEDRLNNRMEWKIVKIDFFGRSDGGEDSLQYRKIQNIDISSESRDFFSEQCPEMAL
jgi:hypothetical protein